VNHPKVPPNYYLGEFRGKLWVDIYDKLGRVIEKSKTDPTVFVPRHAVGWKYITRIEVCLRPRQLGLVGTPEQIREHVVRNILPTLVVIDTRTVPASSALAEALMIVKRDGMLPPGDLRDAVERELTRIEHINLGELAESLMGGVGRSRHPLPRVVPKTARPRRTVAKPRRKTAAKPTYTPYQELVEHYDRDDVQTVIEVNGIRAIAGPLEKKTGLRQLHGFLTCGCSPDADRCARVAA
jgi:hypothetical protein